MPKITIRGYSDDIIELEGAITDEFSAYNGWRYLHFDDGTIVKAGYDQVPDKGWHIEVVATGPDVTVTALLPQSEDGEHFSDVLEIDFPIVSKVACWKHLDGPHREDLLDYFEDFDFRDCDTADLKAIYDALQ